MTSVSEVRERPLHKKQKDVPQGSMFGPAPSSFIFILMMHLRQIKKNSARDIRNNRIIKSTKNLEVSTM